VEVDDDHLGKFRDNSLLHLSDSSFTRLLLFISHSLYLVRTLDDKPLNRSTQLGDFERGRD
jgi:hypothetical protein